MVRGSLYTLQIRLLFLLRAFELCVWAMSIDNEMKILE